MKNYKAIMPIVLVAVMGLSCGSIISNAVSTKQEYNKYVKSARAYAEKRISVDVDEAYQKALDINNNLETYLEWGNYYVNIGDYDTAVSLGEMMVDEFPKKAEAFVFLLQNYAKANEFESFFEEYNHAKTLGVVNKQLEELYNKYKYTYKLGYESYDTAQSFSNGMAVVGISSEQGMKYGYISDNEKSTINTVYIKAGSFNSAEQSVAPVVNDKNECYFITTEGKRKYVVQPDGIEPVEYGVYSSNLLTIFDGSNYYLSDIEGNIVTGPYDYISTVNADICVMKKGDEWTILNSEGNPISDQKFDGFITDEKGIAFRTRLFANIGGMYYLVDEEGKKISDEGYEDAKLFIDSLAAVKQNGKWGFINENGEIIINCQYDDARSFSNNLAAVCIGDKWGYITLSDDGKTVVNAIDCLFDGATDFSRTSHNVMVQEGDRWKLLSLYN